MCTSDCTHWLLIESTFASLNLSFETPFCSAGILRSCLASLCFRSARVSVFVSVSSTPSRLHASLASPQLNNQKHWVHKSLCNIISISYAWLLNIVCRLHCIPQRTEVGRYSSYEPAEREARLGDDRDTVFFFWRGGACVQQLPLPALDSDRRRIRCPHWAQTSITRVIRFYFSNKQDFIALGVTRSVRSNL